MSAAKINIAIQTHTAWLASFHAAVARRDSFDTSQLADDRACAFGAWLHASAAQLPGAGPYRDIQVIHRNFHRDAVAVAMLISRGVSTATIDRALALLNARSARLIEALRDLRESHFVVPFVETSLNSHCPAA